MVVDVGEGGQADRVARPHTGTQVLHVGLGGGVPAVVFDLGVNHQAVGAGLDRPDSERGLRSRVAAVDVLPGADAQAEGVDLGDEGRAELRPVVGAAVRALDEQRLDARGLRLRGDRRQVAAIGLVEVPDPHAGGVERGAGRSRGIDCPARGGGRRRRGADSDRPVLPRSDSRGCDDEDAPAGCSLGDRDGEAVVGRAQAGAERVRVGGACARNGEEHEIALPEVVSTQDELAGDLDDVGVACADGCAHLVTGRRCDDRGRRSPSGVPDRAGGRCAFRGRGRPDAERDQGEPEDLSCARGKSHHKMPG